MTPPNILWICTDQQRYDTIGALGYAHVDTPHVDQLVAEGVAFTHAYCQSPICTPSRASFLTASTPAPSTSMATASIVFPTTRRWSRGCWPRLGTTAG